MILCTANIGRTKMTADRVEADMRKIKSTFRGGAIIGWQEIDEADQADEHAILRRVYRDYYENIAMETRTPISVFQGYEVERSRVIHATGGIPHVSPHRVITEALIRYRRKSPPIVVLNMHYPPGAFNKKIEKTQKQREEHWAEMFEKHQDRLKYWADERGLTTFWMGDVNRQKMPKAHPRERQLVTQGIDSISVVVRSTKVDVVRRGVIDLNSDHNARYVKVNLDAR